jgi:DNA polymerase-3 subunit gamma/tau
MASEPPPWIDAPEASSSRPASGERPDVAVEAASARIIDAAPLGLDSQRLGDRWTDTVRRMIDAGSIGALVRELALQAECVAIDTAATPMVWRLRVERETLRAASHCDKLQAALAEAVGRPVRVETEAASRSTRRPCGRPPSAPAAWPRPSRRSRTTRSCAR